MQAQRHCAMPQRAEGEDGGIESEHRRRYHERENVTHGEDCAHVVSKEVVEVRHHHVRSVGEHWRGVERGGDKRKLNERAS